MDYEIGEELELFALADGPDSRGALVGSVQAATTPGQLFLLGEP